MDYLCELFTCSPAEAVEQDEELVLAVVRSRAARDAAFTFDTHGTAKMNDAQSAIYQRMLSALDERDIKRGVPEEL